MTWAKILDDKYEISKSGKIRNGKTKRIIKQFIGTDGYMRTQIAGKTRLVHRLVASAYIPLDPDREFVNHKDGNKQNNTVRNLEWVTRSENVRHGYSHELYTRPVGTMNPRCKLSEDDVQYIRDNYIRGDPKFGAKALSEKFNVAPQTISAVVSGQNWS